MSIPFCSLDGPAGHGLAWEGSPPLAAYGAWEGIGRGSFDFSFPDLPSRGGLVY